MPDFVSPHPVDLAIVIVNWRVHEALDRCLRAIPGALTPAAGGAAPALECETLVIDNESDPALLAPLAARHPGVRWIANSENRGFAAACNQGIAATGSRHVLLLNPDTEPEPGSLTRLVAWLDRHPEAAVAGPRLASAAGGLELTCRRFPRLAYLLSDVLLLSRVRALRPLFARYYYGEWDYSAARAVDQVSGACFLMRRSAVEQLGALDERFFVYFEEVDWCLRARAAGFEVHYVPEAQVLHHGGLASARAGTARVTYTHQSARAFWAKHHGRLGCLGLEAVLALDRLGRALLRLVAGHGEKPCADSQAS